MSIVQQIKVSFIHASHKVPLPPVIHRIKLNMPLLSFNGIPSYTHAHTKTAQVIISQNISSNAGAGEAALSVVALLVTATVVYDTFVQVWVRVDSFTCMNNSLAVREKH